MAFDPYGTILYQQASTGATTELEEKFTGQILDIETGLYYYNARYYDPEVGVFLSADSIVPDPYDSQSLNRYMYVSGNPVRYSDPTGRAQDGGNYGPGYGLAAMGYGYYGYGTHGVSYESWNGIRLYYGGGQLIGTGTLSGSYATAFNAGGVYAGGAIPGYAGYATIVGSHLSEENIPMTRYRAFFEFGEQSGMHFTSERIRVNEPVFSFMANPDFLLSEELGLKASLTIDFSKSDVHWYSPMKLEPGKIAYINMEWFMMLSAMRGEYSVLDVFIHEVGEMFYKVGGLVHGDAHDRAIRLNNAWRASRGIPGTVGADDQSGGKLQNGFNYIVKVRHQSELREFEFEVKGRKASWGWRW